MGQETIVLLDSVAISKTFMIPKMFIAVLVITTNSILIHTLKKLGKLQTISFKFILSLCISDICIGLTLIISEATGILFSGTDHLMFSLHIWSVMLSFVTFSILATVSIALDRFIHMRYLTRYPLVMTSHKAWALLLGNIITSISFSAICLYKTTIGYTITAELYESIIIAIFVCIAFLLYIKAYVSMKARSRRIILNNVGGPENIPIQDQGYEFSRLVLFILGSLLTCYTPIVVSSVLMFRDYPHITRKDLLLRTYSEFLVYVNAAMNPVIMIISSRALRAYVGRLFCCRSVNQVDCIYPI